MRKEFYQGKLVLNFKEEVFSLQKFKNLVEDNKDSVETFRQRQAAAFAKECEIWREDLLLHSTNIETHHLISH